MPVKKQTGYTTTLAYRKKQTEKVLETIFNLRLERPRGWDRTWLVRLFVEQWEELPAYGWTELSSTARVRSERIGERVPDECFAMKDGQEVGVSQSQTIRAYIKNVVLVAMQEAGCKNIPTMDEILTPVEYDRQGVAYVAIYRKRG